jgi:hypothetical protein
VPPLLVLLTGITLQLGAGLLLSRERMVFEPRRPRG